MVEKKQNIISPADLFWAGSVTVAFVLAMFLPFWMKGHSVYFAIIEEGFPISANYPWDLFAARCVASGRFPLWNPYLSSGTVFIANWLESFFFFPRWILYLSPSIILRDAFVEFRYWLGGMFFYIFARRIGLKNSGAIVGVICFLSGGYFTRYYNENYLNIELMLGLWLLAAEYLAKRRSLRATLLTGLAVLGILLAGHPESAFSTLSIMGLWVIYRSGHKAPRSVALFIVAGLGAGLAAGAQLIPFAESWAFSTNYHIPSLGHVHYEIRHLASLAFPWIYGKFSYFLSARRLPDTLSGSGYLATTINWLPYYLGAVPLLLSSIGFLEIRRVNRAAPFFFTCMIVTIGAIFGIEPFRQLTALPLISRLGNYKHLFPMITFSIALTAGMGAEWILGKNPRELPRSLFATAFLLIVIGIYAVYKNPAMEGWYYMLFYGVAPVAILLLFSLIPSRRLKLVGIVVPLLVMALSYPKGYTYKHQEGLLGMGKLPFMRYLRVHNTGRFLSLYPPLFPNLGMVWNLSDVRASDALQPKPYWRILLDVNGGDEKYMHSYFLAAGLIGPMPEKAVDPKLKELGLEYIVSPGDLGGAIMVNYLVRTANVKAPEWENFYWSLWNIGGGRMPVLLTHPPALIELPDRLPPQSEKLQTAIAFNPRTPPGTDGAFMSIIEETGGKRRAIYCRHILREEKSRWIAVPNIPPPSVGAKRYLLVHPCNNTEHDWVGWGYKSIEKNYAGFTPVVDGDVMVYKSLEPPRQATLLDEKGAIVNPDPTVTMNFPDEYLVDAGGRNGKLTLDFLGYRPGWKAWADGHEIRINADRSVELKKATGKVILKYQPISFDIGLWVSIISAVFGMVIYLRSPNLCHQPRS